MRKKTSARDGIALVMVLILIVMISLGAYAFTDLMLAQQGGTQMSGRRVQAESAVASGVERIKYYMAQDIDYQLALGGHYDNPTYFGDVIVDPATNLRFSVISIVEDVSGVPGGPRYGLYDLGARLNVNELATSDAYKVQVSGGSEANRENSEAGDADTGDTTGAETPPVDGETGESGEDGLEVDPARDALMMLPGMTIDIADSILDWIDEDDIPRAFGAESSYYSSDGYAPRNGPINSIDELLLVNGVTQQLLFGADRNHNGMIDENEQNDASGMQLGLASMDRGWSSYLTAASSERPLPNPIDLNDDDLEALYDSILEVPGMTQDMATFIAAYRQKGPYTPPQTPEEGEEGEDQGDQGQGDQNQGGDQGQSDAGQRGEGGESQGGDNQGGGQQAPPPEIVPVNGQTVDLTQAGGQKFTSILDLFDSFTQFDEKTVFESPFTLESAASILPTLMANFVAGESGGTGKININQCSQPSLASVPGMTEVLAQDMLAQQDRTGIPSDPNYLYPTWPMAQGLVTVEEMKALLPFMSTSGAILTAQVFAYSDIPGQFARAEVVIDASDGTPRVVSWRDLTHLGPGFTFDTAAVQP